MDVRLRSTFTKQWFSVSLRMSATILPDSLALHFTCFSLKSTAHFSLLSLRASTRYQCIHLLLDTFFWVFFQPISMRFIPAKTLVNQQKSLCLPPKVLGQTPGRQHARPGPALRDLLQRDIDSVAKCYFNPHIA
jgi:hypothetical protein